MRLRRFRVAGDGACLFRAVAQGLSYMATGKLLRAPQEDRESFVLRQLAVQHTCDGIRLRGNEFALDPMEHCVHMRQPETFGTGVELSALATALDVCFRVFSVDTKSWMQVGQPSATRAVMLAYEGQHYDLLVE